MTDLARIIFWSLLTEIFFVGLAIVLRDDKRKVMTVLLVGTFFSGVVGFGQAMLLYVTENAPSLPNISLPQPSLQSQVADKVDTIFSYKAQGVGRFTQEDGKVITIQFNDEYVRPNKLHTIQEEDGRVTEQIFVGDRYCGRQGNDNWLCDSGFEGDEVENWVNIVLGEPGLETIRVLDHGTRTEKWNGKECILYYKTQTYTDMNAEDTLELCVDPNTLLPVKYAYTGNWPDNPGTKVAFREYDLYDINVPIDISLPE